MQLILKKLFLIIVINILISTGAFARNEDSFYMKANVGANWMNKIKDEDGVLTSKTAAFLSFGWGFFIIDKFRTDFTIEKIIDPTFKGKGKIKRGQEEIGVSIKQWSDIYALMVNTYIDLFESKIIGIFGGAGVGASLVKSREENLYSFPNNNITKDFLSTEYKVNVAYHITAGAFKEVSEGVNIEIAYSWREYGKAGKFKDSDTNSAYSYKGHNLIAGIRLDL